MDNITCTLDEAPPGGADAFAPDYEGHYQKLLTALRWRATAPQPSFWGWLADPHKDLRETERLRQYCEDVALLPLQLVYFDLESIGIEPRLARVLLLARLLADNAPINHLHDELRIAVADVIESRSAGGDPAKTVVMPFTERMQVEPMAEGADLRAADTPATGFDSHKWSKAMAQQIWGIA